MPMDDALLRLAFLVRTVVPFVLFMASVYLALHALFAGLITNPASPFLWFFGVVTGPLTRPIRALLPVGIPERRVRLISLGVYVALWLASRVVLLSPWGGAG